MASKLIVLAAAFVACQAGPVWFVDNGVVPSRLLFVREGRSPDFVGPSFAPPSFAYGFGSGLSYDIGGIKHSSGIGASFQSGEGKAYGAGFGDSNGKTSASGIGYANANPSPQPTFYRTNYPYGYSPYNNVRRDYGNNYGNNYAVSSLNRNQQNIGNYGTAIAQSNNSPYGSSATAVQNGGGFQSVVSSAQNIGGQRNTFSAAQNNDGYGLNSAVAASHNGGGVSASTAQTTQQIGGGVRQTGAFSYGAPGVETAQSHIFNTGNQ